MHDDYIGGVQKGVGVEVLSPAQKFRGFAIAEPNSQFHNLIRIPVSFICKLSGTPD
jgi:hypothetical protein